MALTNYHQRARNQGGGLELRLKLAHKGQQASPVVPTQLLQGCPCQHDTDTLALKKHQVNSKWGRILRQKEPVSLSSTSEVGCVFCLVLCTVMSDLLGFECKDIPKTEILFWQLF